MVSQNSPPNNPHNFSIPDQTHFQNQHFDPYTTSMSGNTNNIHTYGEELNLLGTTPNETHQYRQRPMSSNLVTPTYFEASSLAMGVAYSKYLKPAQLLLEEMVSVGGEVVSSSNEKFVRKLLPNSRTGSMMICSELKAEICGGGVSGDNQAQVRLVKLISLLEEVERRYEQYYHHLEEAVSSFEVIAGLGIGKYYTALALQAMSRHFCTLRDSIKSQILIARQKINQELTKPDSGLSQVSLIDKENREKCRISLQQIGILQTQKQVWRPIRGLPETSVLILRSWLFEHFLHPYPNDFEKLMLSSKTGLTKNQVSNWFINARVRLWKPMIEEMYNEEFAESSAESDPLLATNSED